MTRWTVFTAGVIALIVIFAGCGGAGAGGDGSPDITTGLVAYYPFSGNANDASGNGNDPADPSDVTASLTTDRFGDTDAAYEFNGSSFIEVPSSASLESPTSEGTISAWFRADSLSVTTGNFDPILIKSDDSSISFMYQFFVRDFEMASQFNDYDSSNGIDFVATTFTFQTDQWYHVAVSWTGTSVNHYVDGALIGTGTVALPPSNNSNPLVIGADFPGLNEFFDGTLDEIRIYNRALSAAEIQAVYQAE